MLRWFGPRKGSPDGQTEEVTEDPLAAIGPKRKGDRIYSVSRVNPIFDDGCPPTAVKVKAKPTRNSYSPSAQKSDSSGYGGSRVGPSEKRLRLRDDLVVEQNSAYVKSIEVGPLCVKSVPSLGSGSSTKDTLTTIPEGKVDFGVPKPIWPNGPKQISQYDSLVDDALLFYTSTSYVPNEYVSLDKDVSLREVLVDLSDCISATIEGKNDVAPEVMLKAVKEKITASLGLLRNSTEEDMRKLCVNLSKLQQVNSVVRAFTNSSSSGNSSQGSPELNSARERIISDEADEIYQVPSGSSSSGFSDSVKHYPVAAKFTLPQDNAVLHSQGVRNAIICGTLCRTNFKVSSVNDKLVCGPNGNGPERKRSLLQSNPDSKPSVWQQYYGVNIAHGSGNKYNPKPSDVPLYPGGRPEADFTLDVPRSELLAKRMKQDKKWRLRCRLITSFLGLVFFLLSVMAVSLMLTRGKRMFGSMM